MFSETKLEICKSKFSSFPTAGQGKKKSDDIGQEEQAQQICFYLLQETLVRYALHLQRKGINYREIRRKAQKELSSTLRGVDQRL